MNVLDVVICTSYANLVQLGSSQSGYTKSGIPSQLRRTYTRIVHLRYVLCPVGRYIRECVLYVLYVLYVLVCIVCTVRIVYMHVPYVR